MGRACHIAQKEGQRGRSSAQGRPQFLVFSTHPNARSVAPVSSPNHRGEGEPASVVPEAGSTSPLLTGGEDPTYLVPQADQASASASGSRVLAASHHGTSSSNQYLLFLNLILESLFLVNKLYRSLFCRNNRFCHSHFCLIYWLSFFLY